MIADTELPSTTELASPPLLVDVAEACRLLSISSRLLWTLTASGEIPVVRLGRRTLYSPKSLEEWVRQSETGG